MTGRIEARYLLERGDFSLDVDLDLPTSGITGLFGISGSGKTSLLRCIAGLERAGRARLVIDGDVIEDNERSLSTAVHRRGISVVFQEPRLFANLDVRGNIHYGAKRAGLQPADDDGDILELLGLRPLLDRPAATLSGGEAQRVSIARALLSQPRLVLMDEPLSSLDQARRDDVLPYLENLHAALKVPLVYVSHQPDEILRLADTLVVMDAGRAVLQGDLAEVLGGPAGHTLPAAMIAAVLEGTAKTPLEEYGLTEVETAAGAFLVTSICPPGTRLRLVIRASDVSVSKTMPEGSSIQNSLPATIAGIEEEGGATTLLRLDCGGRHLLARVTRRAVAQLGLEPGQHVFAHVKTAAVRKAAGSASIPVPAQA